MGEEMGIDENGWERTGSHGMGEKMCNPSAITLRILKFQFFCV